MSVSEIHLVMAIAIIPQYVLNMTKMMTVVNISPMSQQKYCLL